MDVLGDSVGLVDLLLGEALCLRMNTITAVTIWAKPSWSMTRVLICIESCWEVYAQCLRRGVRDARGTIPEGRSPG